MRGGIELQLGGAPLELVMPSNPIAEVALRGADYPGIRPQLRVAAGDRVRAGEVLFVDRRRPEIAFTAPASGTVSEIRFGHRRQLAAVAIRVADDADDAAVEFATGGTAEEILLASGLWTSFLARPFGRIPDPGTRPACIIVAAIDTRPLAADPMIAIELDREAFRQGIEVLHGLAPGKVILCHAAGKVPPAGAGEFARLVAVHGRHPAGLPGTHVHYLASAERQVAWCINHADVIAIGHLFLLRRLPKERIIAVAGPGMANPGLIRMRPGARLADILTGELKEEAGRILSGDALSGQASEHLGRYHNQITILAGAGEIRPGGLAARLDRLLPGTASPAIVPREILQRALPATLPAVPLLRALRAGDAQRARDYGCLALVEEDLALARHLCETGADYPLLLRRVLDDLAAGQAA